MRMRGSSHPGTEVLIEYNSTPTGTPGDPSPGCQAEPLPHHFLNDSGSQSLVLRAQSHVDRGRGPHPEETPGEDRGSPRDACVALQIAVGDHEMWRSRGRPRDVVSRYDVTDPTEGEKRRPGSRSLRLG